MYIHFIRLRIDFNSLLSSRKYPIEYKFLNVKVESGWIDRHINVSKTHSCVFHVKLFFLSNAQENTHVTTTTTQDWDEGILCKKR